MYMLTWETPVSRGRLRSPHAVEIPLVFDNVEKARNFVGRGGDPQAVADRMSDAWLAFARTGDPGWDAYDPDARATMLFDVESRLTHDPLPQVRAILER
jgi:para-nitrobenzyl esterase